MIVTLSPAKLMDFTPVPVEEKTLPLFHNEADGLMKLLENYSPQNIAHLMAVNPKLGFEVYQNIHSFFSGKSPVKQAAYAYNGIAYQGLDYESLREEDAAYGQDHLVILSGLYGALRPFDLIKPHRLEMQIKLGNDNCSDLYGFWKERLTQYLINRLHEDDNIWVNLMSNEYTKVIDKKRLPSDVTIITPDFKEQTSTGYRQVVVHTKKARGMLARFIIENRITEIEHLKAFDYEGYSYSGNLSNNDKWVFVR